MNTTSRLDPKETYAKIIYVLYPLSLFLPLAAVVGVVMAYMSRSDAPEWIQVHYGFQIRTFWIGLLFFILAAITLPFLFGWALFLFYLVWLIGRCLNGFMAMNRKEAIGNPESWLFG